MVINTVEAPELTLGMRRHSSASSVDGDGSPFEVPDAEGRRNTDSAAPKRPRPLSPSPSPSPSKLDRRRSADHRPLSARSRRSGNFHHWKSPPSSPTPTMASPSTSVSFGAPPNGKQQETGKTPTSLFDARRPRVRSPWGATILTLATSIIGIGLLVAILNSLTRRQLDAKGCRMSYMRPTYARLNDFDTEHTRFATKYSLYLYREQGINDDTRLGGIPVLFIPGNAGSYKQVRPIAAEAASYFHDVLQHNSAAIGAGVRGLDFFTVDFNEDFSAFHGQTLLDQAEYLNEAIRYILSLYLDPHMSHRHADLADPSSVIILGHSMGGIVARSMLIMPNYQSNSINTIITMSTPHSRAPVTFDGQMVKLYRDINDYWRFAYSQQWANDNPLWHVTLVSIAGGGLDTIVPSDYASVESLVPDTHGFTVFTTTIPTVWTAMDHQAILWCDQFRKVIARALYDIVDANRATQTKPRAERMRVFKKYFLTGMEPISEQTAALKEHSTLLTLEDKSGPMIKQGERLVLPKLGTTGKVRAHLLPIPPPGPARDQRFTLLTDGKLDHAGETGQLEVLFCSVFHLQPGQSAISFSTQMDLSGEHTASTRLACKNAAADVITLPASTRFTKHPFYSDGEKEIKPFSYLQYDVDKISDHQFVVVVEKTTTPTPGFLVAEFADDHVDKFVSRSTVYSSLRHVLAFGVQVRLPSKRPMMTELKVPSLQSSLLAYKLEISQQACGDEAELFTPLVRQYLTEPYESKFFVNARRADVSLHGLAPFNPPRLKRRSGEEGLTFQFWTDPTCDSSMDVKLSVDVMGSLGKLYMRYRTVVAAFPLLVVALVLRKQFRIYDNTGVFVSFTESLDMCLRQSLPLMLMALTVLSLSNRESGTTGNVSASFWHWSNATSPAVDFHTNDLLVGTRDPFFWFLIPLIGVICVGVCTVLNYMTLALTHLLGLAMSMAAYRPGWTRHDEGKRTSAGFVPCTPRRRMITTAILLFLVSTVIPYQFAYLVACLVQLSTTVRAHRVASELRSSTTQNFYNYVHSIFMLMLWVLPINLPILVVWIHNLAVHWLTPFSSHHNVLSIMPFVVLVETLTAGKMVPRVTSRLGHVTSVLLLGIATYAAVYGVSYAYMLHYLVNLVATWLVVLHFTSNSWSLSGLDLLYEETVEDRKRGKEP